MELSQPVKDEIRILMTDTTQSSGAPGGTRRRAFTPSPSAPSVTPRPISALPCDVCGEAWEGKADTIAPSGSLGRWGEVPGASHSSRRYDNLRCGPSSLQ